MKSLVIALLFFLSLCNGVEFEDEESDVKCKYHKYSIPRPHSVSILEFGAVGDGKTLNTLSFQNAIFYVRSFADKGGAQLYVPAGKWLTGSFNLTSHLTLFLDRNAAILASQDPSKWEVVEPLPSYGRGIELPGGRYHSLMTGFNLTDVVITGDNGTIDGKGGVWWKAFDTHSLNYSRPHLVEFINSNNIVISNLTFLNSPLWSIHPVYCNNVRVQNVTIHAPPDSPCTSGIVPDSSSDICIEDCFVRTGHDAITVKSGWDEYGISYGRPSKSIYINDVHLQTSLGSALAFGSEMSGGISSVHIEHIHIFDSFTGIKFKTVKGRGGFIKDIIIDDVKMENIHVALEVTGHCGDHPDDHYDPTLIPLISQITLKNIIGQNISVAGYFDGIDESPFTSICLSNISLSISESVSSWICSNVQGFSDLVFPEPCPELRSMYSNSSSTCFSFQSLNGEAESL